MTRNISKIPTKLAENIEEIPNLFPGEISQFSPQGNISNPQNFQPI